MIQGLEHAVEEVREIGLEPESDEPWGRIDYWHFPRLVLFG
jgi:hypothetical protein